MKLCLTLGRTCKLIPPPWYKGRGVVGIPPPPRVFVTLRYFEKFLPLIDSVLCRLQDDINIMGYIHKWSCWRPVTSSNMGDCFTFSTFPLYFSFIHRKFNVFLRKYTFQQLSTWKMLKYIIMLLFNYFWLRIWLWKLLCVCADFHQIHSECVSKINEQLQKWTSAQIKSS